jgi:hypothetical protein
LDAINRLNEIARRLGIEFIEPQTIVAQLCAQRQCTLASILDWLETEAALDYIRRTYGESYKLPGCVYL